MLAHARFRILTARSAPELLHLLVPRRKKRARETPGGQCTRSLACENKKARRVSHHRFTGTPRRFPRNGFNGFLRALPSDRALLPLSSVDRLTNLMPASGHQDHTTSPSAASIVRLSIPPRPPHPAPRS